MPMIQGNAAQVESLPAPVGGWNARDSIANMEPMDAVILDNYFPTVSSCVLRGGYSQYATVTGTVKTLLSYSGGNVSELFAITSAGIYQVDAGGAGVVQTLPSALTEAWCEYVNIATSGGNFIFVVNGADDALLYNGTTWTNPSVTFPSPYGAYTTAKFSNITLFKNRLWFIEKYTLRAWYLDTNSIGGEAKYIDLSSVAKFGGHLVDLDTWTLDGGYGIDDNLAFVTNNGEVIVYRGTDPDSAATWSLTGVWKLGSPIGTRAMLKYGGDLLILTYDGLMPMAQSLQSSRLDPRVALSNKIQGAIAKATTSYGSHTATGWQVFYSAKNNALWINVPVQDDLQEQYVMNTITTSWCRFTGWGAYCWETFDDDAFFGGNGFVGKAWAGTYSDNNNPIIATGVQAYNYFGSRGMKKYFTRARPSIFTDGQPSVGLAMNVDFQIDTNAATVNYTGAATGSKWDNSRWDQDYWSVGLLIQNNWRGIGGIGYCGSLVFKTASAVEQIEWASTDVVYQLGWAGI